VVDTRSPDGLVAIAFKAVGAVTMAAMLVSMRKRQPAVPAVGTSAAPVAASAVHAARRLNRSAGTLAASVLFDSAVEHYRGGFRNKAMYTPIVTSALALAVSAHGTADGRQVSHRVRDVIYTVTAAVGLVGTLFHIRNLRKRPGKFTWQNLFYGAPLGAPAAIGLSGLLGYLSERIRDTPVGMVPTIGGFSAGRVVGLSTAAGIMGTVSEAWLLHFRGSFHNPLMYLPITMPPMASATVAAAALGQTRTSRPLTRWWLRATALLGVSGTLFHMIGVGRDMGGWRNWQQNVLNGPPIPAPPAFTGLAMAGLAALSLLEDHSDD